MFQKEDIITSHLKKKAQSKLTLAISAFAVIITSTGYLFNSKEVIFLFYIFNFIFFYNLIIYYLLKKNDIN
ncbi:hypothetical protein HIMB114_00000090 [alpha proteobacterium HIMB114]|nr:hypothetical protein HIMB114_00000090 [alpha proteobacterium HIMB114]